MENPLVTIISPCYNHSKFVIESLDSIRNQTYTNIQHIIIDDCSKDDSVEKIEKWIAEHNYKCTFIKHERNTGVSCTLNESIKLARGKYWTGLATDDVMSPDRVKKMVDYLENNKSVPMVVGDVLFINDNSEVILYNGFQSGTSFYSNSRKNFDFKEYGTYQSLLAGNYITSSFLLRTDVFEKTGLYNTSLQLEDWDMWLRISRTCGQIKYLDEPLTYYRVHGTNSISNNEMMLDGHIKTFLSQRPFCREGENKKAFEKHFMEINRVHIKNIKILSQLLRRGGFSLAIKATVGNLIQLAAKKMKVAKPASAS